MCMCVLFYIMLQFNNILKNIQYTRQMQENGSWSRNNIKVEIKAQSAQKMSKKWGPLLIIKYIIKKY